MRALLLVASLFLTTLAAPAAASADVFSQMGARYGVDPALLRAVAWKESRWHPWTLNIGGEGFYLSSKAEALRVAKQSFSSPWLLVVNALPKSEASRYLFGSRTSAMSYLQSKGLKRYRLDYVQRGGFDVGVMQIHWRFHSKGAPSLERLMDTDYNVAYGAKFLSELINANGLEKGVGMYHSSQPERRAAYSKDVLNIYRNLKRREGATNVAMR